MAFTKNDLVELEITGYTAEGSGVGRAEGMAIFVPLAAKGDLLTVRILKTAKTYAFGKIERILRASPDRAEPGCPQFARCGGCVYRHIKYKAEVEAKALRVKDAMERIGGFHELEIQPIMGAAEPDHYRNKAQLPIGKYGGDYTLGFYAAHSHRIIDCAACALQPEPFTAAMNAFKEWAGTTKEPPYDELTGKGRLRHFYLRQAKATGEIMACLVVNGNGSHFEAELSEALQKAVPDLKSVVINSNREKSNVILGARSRVVWGADYLTDRLCGLEFHISPASFYQVNHDQAERLYGKAAEYAALTGAETLLDLYCGTGTIGLSMAANAGKVIGVESVEAAVEDAKRNASRNNIENAEFYCMDAAKAASMFKNQGLRPDVVVLDPPRKGLDPALPDIVAGMGPKRVVYVSCDPATLARDLKRFAELGYPPATLTPVDMFPRTAHVESVVLLEKGCPLNS